MNGNVEKIRRIKERYSDSIFERANVVGVGIGRRIKGGQLTDEMCLKIYVEKKLAKSQLAKKNLIPEQLRGVRTDVVGVGKIRFFQCDQRTRKRPAFGGDSCGSCHTLRYGYIMAGTLGCVVIDNTDGNRCILSNNHVLADYDSDAESRASAGDPIVQPGTLDGGSCVTDQIATLKRWIPFQTAADNLVDAAIGDIITDNDVSDEIGCDNGPDVASCSLGGPMLVCNFGGPYLNIRSRRVNGIRELTTDDIDTLQVQKCGRTTCYTTGTVIDIDATVDVGYEVLTDTGIDARTYRFVHQILTTSMSDHGDSGSLIMDMERRAVGLLFAGSDIITVANPIQTVFDELDIEFPTPEVHCFIGGPDKQLHCLSGPDTIHCLLGGPDRPCIVGGPIDLGCAIGGPNKLCIIGGPGSGCTVGGPDVICRPGGPYLLVRCLACGPDSPIGCGTGGPDLLVDTIQCAAGPGIDLRFKIPFEDPSRLVVLDTEKIPKPMRKAFTEMLKAMAKER